MKNSGLDSKKPYKISNIQCMLKVLGRMFNLYYLYLQLSRNSFYFSDQVVDTPIEFKSRVAEIQKFIKCVLVVDGLKNFCLEKIECVNKIEVPAVNI